MGVRIQLKNLSSSALTRRITLQQLAPAPDGQGGTSSDWATISDLWAAVYPWSGSESQFAGFTRQRVTHRIYIRYQPTIIASVIGEVRFLYNARPIGIISMVDMEEGHEFIYCDCEEGVAT